MEKEERDKIIGKLKKLLALGMKHEDSPEGQSALDKAKELMAVNNIRFMDIEEDGTADENNVKNVWIKWNSYSNDFEQYLAKHIAETLDCSYIRHNFRRKDAAHIIIGLPTDMDLAEWLFKFTRLQCYQLADKSGFKGTDLRTYFYSMYFVLKKRITEVFGKAEDMTSDCRDLVLVKKDVVDQKKNELFPDLTNARKTRMPVNGSFDAVLQGRADGHKVSLHRQVGKEEREHIGG